MRDLQGDVRVVGAAVIEQQAEKRDQIGDDLLEAGDVEIVVVQGDRTEGRMQLRRDVGDHADEQGVRKEARLRPVKPREDDRAGKQIKKERNQIPGTVDDAPVRIKRLRQMSTTRTETRSDTTCPRTGRP